MSESKVRELIDMAKRDVREVKVGDEVMKLKDFMGNDLTIGSTIQLTGEWHQLIGKIVEFHAGGILVGTAYGKDVPQGQTPSRLRILVDMTLAIQPGASVLSGSFRLANPMDGEVIVKTETKSQA
jgi:hypothetical protein